MKATALELFGGLAASYERALDAATLVQDRYWKKWVVESSGVGEADTVLDIGCGTLLLEERLLPTRCRVVGLDLTEEMIRVGQAKRLPNVPLLVNADAESLPFPDRSFDAIVSCYVAKYVDLGKFANELSRVVKPGGKVVLYDFVKPRGLFLPFLALYLHGALRVAGFLLGLVGNNAAFTLSNLPRIIEGATWDRGLVAQMKARGFETNAFRRLSGGVVSAYSGTRRSERGPLGRP